MRAHINDELYRKFNKLELLDKRELRSKIVPNITEKLMSTINEYDRLKDVKPASAKDEKQIADLISLIGSYIYAKCWNILSF